MGDHRAGDVRCSDRVIDRVRVIAGGVGTDRQRRWNRCCDRRCWHRRRQQTGGTRADQTDEQNLFTKETEGRSNLVNCSLSSHVRVNTTRVYMLILYLYVIDSEIILDERDSIVPTAVIIADILIYELAKSHRI